MIARGLLVLVIVAGCGGTPGAPTGSAPAGPPNQHRPSPMTCPTRPAGMSCAAVSGTPYPTCTSDADCTAGNGGRCEGVQIGCTCTYDACYSDGDCKSNEACVCAPNLYAGNPAGNACVPAQCHRDADCASGFCSPSLGTGCIPSLSVVGLYCHGSSDECNNDSDCHVGAFCMYHPELAHWACTAIQCGG